MMIFSPNAISRWAFCLLVTLFLVPFAEAQSSKRLGIIDVETDGISDDEKSEILAVFRKRLSEQRILVVVSEQEIRSYLVQKNPLREKFKAEVLLQENRLAEAKQLLQEGWNNYRASQFGEAISILETAWSLLDEAPLVVDLATALEMLALLASSHFFQGNDDEARSAMQTILDLSPNHFLDVQKFPPPVIELFQEIKSGSRFAWRNQAVEGDLDGVIGKILGRGVRVTGQSILLPLGHPRLGNVPLVLYKKDVYPITTPVNEVPSVIQFETLRDKKASTKGLLRPVGDFVTPPLQLKSLAEQMDLSVVLLAFATKDLANNYVIRGQWMEVATSRSSPVIERKGEDLSEVVTQLTQEMLRYISPDGQVLADLDLGSTIEGTPFESSLESPAKSYYKTWWFWTLVGVGVAGIGTGTYFLVKPNDTLNFSVSEGN